MREEKGQMVRLENWTQSRGNAEQEENVTQYTM